MALIHASRTDILGDKYITLDVVISELQKIRNENIDKDILVCFSEDKMNGYLDRRSIRDFILCSDNVVEIS